jgi:hypothetical protein
MRHLAILIEQKRERDPAARRPTDAELRHAMAALWELHDLVHEITTTARRLVLLRFVAVPMLRAIERDNAILRDFIDDVEMRLSPEFRESAQTAIAELKPPTGVDWKASLESMRN